jgi:hypothetical protein
MTREKEKKRKGGILSFAISYNYCADDCEERERKIIFNWKFKHSGSLFENKTAANKKNTFLLGIR